MSENQKKDAGKPRLDLIPWADITIVDGHGRAPGDLFDGLKAWWTGRPHPLALAIPRAQLPGIAAVLGFGAAKYRARGWEDGIAFSRIFAAAGRHAMAHDAGELLDPESGLPHVSHFWCNVLFLVVYTARSRGDLDDRPEASKSTLEAFDRMNALVAQMTGQTPVSGAGLSGTDGKGAN